MAGFVLVVDSGKSWGLEMNQIKVNHFDML